MYINARGDGIMQIGSLGIKNAGNYGNGFALYQGSDGDTVLNAYSGQNIDFKINNVTKMRLASNGYFGIGITNPSCALDVSGVINSNNLPKYWNFIRLFQNGGIISNGADAYFLIGTLADYNAGFNCGSINIKGTIGSFTKTEKSVVDITITSRGATATTISVIGTMNGTITLTRLKTFNDFVVYYYQNKYYIYYKVKSNQYCYFDFAVSGNDMNSNSSTLSEPTATYTTTVSGTLLEGTASILSELSQQFCNSKPLVGYYHVGTQPAPNGTEIKVKFNTIDPSFNNFSGYIGLEKNNDHNEFKNTSGTTKIYYVSAHISITKNTSDYRYLWIGVNYGAQRIGFVALGTGTATNDGNNFIGTSGIVLLQPNDWFSIFFYQGSPNELTLGTSGTYPYYSMNRIIITLL
jgi:hypothetical protein